MKFKWLLLLIAGVFVVSGIIAWLMVATGVVRIIPKGEIGTAASTTMGMPWHDYRFVTTCYDMEQGQFVDISFCQD